MGRKVLGKGLEVLIPADKRAGEVVLELDLDQIATRKEQPRQHFPGEEMKELMASIREKGVIQPIIVRPKGDGYELIAGERRVRAARSLGKRRIPAVVRGASDSEALELALIENIQRAALNPMEEAVAYARLAETWNLTQEKLSRDLGKQRVSIANTLRLLKLPPEVQAEVTRGRISRGHALALLGLEKAEEQKALARRIVNKGLSVREVERLVRSQKKALPRKKGERAKDPHLSAIERELEERLGTKVNISGGEKGGKVEISYYSGEDLERILSLLHR